MASLLEVMATKLKVVQVRAAYKDYLDVARVLEEGVDLATGLAAARAVYGAAFNPMVTLKALSYFGDGDLGRLGQDLQQRRREAVDAVDLGTLPMTPELQEVARRVVWYDTPEQTLANEKLFLAHVMVYGTLEEVLTVKRHFTDADFRKVLDDPPAGVFDARSWAYWNLVFGRSPAPPLRARKLE